MVERPMMAGSNVGLLKQLEAKAPILFLLGGGLYSILVVNRILTTYTGNSFSLASTSAFAGEIFVVLGLIGLYLVLVERRPYLTRAAAVVAVIAALASSVAFLGEILKAAGVLAEAPGPLRATPFVAIIGVNVALLLFGISVLLVDVHPRIVGALMVLDTVMFPLWLTVLSGVPAFIGNLLTLVVYVGVGFALWTGDVPTAGVDTSAEPAM